MDNRDIYRKIIAREKRRAFEIRVKETDLHIQAASTLKNEARESILKHRTIIENYIARFPDFAGTLTPWPPDNIAPKIIQQMISAGKSAGVGPMAAVAGVMAEFVGRDLLQHSPEIIVENGGDIFLKTDTPQIIALYAGKSRLSLKVGLRLDTRKRAVGVCTSSGTIGHSLSMGRADAVCVVSEDCALADAAATSVGNRIKNRADIQSAVDFAKNIKGVKGLVVIIGDDIGIWGDIEIVPVQTA